MTYEESYDAMRVVLAGEAAPESLGAMLMLLRMKGEVASEIAGFTAALRDDLPQLPKPDLDWPSYAAGRTRGLPYFLLSAKLLATAGYKTLLHGFNGEGPAAMSIRDGLPHAGIPVCESVDEIHSALDGGNIGYVPLEVLSPELHQMLLLRADFGLRSCLNTVSRMLNPGAAPASVQGVFHPSYRELQADASEMLKLPSLTVIKGGGGEFERNPSKDIVAFGLREGLSWEHRFEPSLEDTRKLNDGEKDPERLADLWSGTLDDPFAVGIVLSTAGLALDTLGVDNPEARARELWDAR
jgi:anthranilate phosphoribosyltransferase